MDKQVRNARATQHALMLGLLFLGAAVLCFTAPRDSAAQALQTRRQLPNFLFGSLRFQNPDLPDYELKLGQVPVAYELVLEDLQLARSGSTINRMPKYDIVSGSWTYSEKIGVPGWKHFSRWSGSGSFPNQGNHLEFSNGDGSILDIDLPHVGFGAGAEAEWAGKVLRLRFDAQGSNWSALGTLTSKNPKYLDVWMNTFIPKDIPGVTHTVAGSGMHGGKTAISGPIPGVSDCFLTDQRDFFAGPNCDSRGQTRVRLGIPNFEVTQLSHCGETIEVDCESGEEEWSGRSSSAGLGAEELTSPSRRTHSLRFGGALANPRYAASPNIDYSVDVIVALDPKRRRGAVSANGLVEPFPAFEMYVATRGALGQRLFHKRPDPGTDPWNLIGPANQPVSGATTFTY